ncbi:MAG: flavodoxin [Clostridia bacterium]|nr:flavodoxin [Clostridia bacterium]
MSKGIILVQSRYGTAKIYADWLAEATGYDMMEAKKAAAASLQAYDVILLGGGVYASSISGMGVLKKHIAALQGKKIAVFAVGAAPHDEPTIAKLRGANLRGALSGIPLFYCRGAWDMEKLRFLDRTLCRMLSKAAGQDGRLCEPWMRDLLSAPGQKHDWTDRAYLKPLLRYIGEA